jgi:D-alanyl-D-alanine carboxypeptidase
MRIGLRVASCGAGPRTAAPAGVVGNRVASLQVSPHRSFARWNAALALVLSLALGACSTTNFQEKVVAPSMAPQSFTSTSTKYAAIVIDGANGKVLYQSSAEALRYPASLTKMMTLYLLFEAMQSGRVTRETQIPVSDYARSRPPTKIGFKSGQSIDAESAIMALVTKSANDVAVAIGEYLGGSEDNFATMMTARARQIGMRSTTFRNASGLPDPGQVTTARDMALLGVALRTRFPQYYSYFSVKNFNYRGRTIRGHNDLIGGVDGVDGIKTGYTRASGYNVVTSVTRGNRKLVAVVMGGDTARNRNAAMAALIERYIPERSF